jgi:hypothetical protein
MNWFRPSAFKKPRIIFTNAACCSYFFRQRCLVRRQAVETSGLALQKPILASIVTSPGLQ